MYCALASVGGTNAPVLVSFAVQYVCAYQVRATSVWGLASRKLQIFTAVVVPGESFDEGARVQYVPGIFLLYVVTGLVVVLLVRLQHIRVASHLLISSQTKYIVSTMRCLLSRSLATIILILQPDLVSLKGER